ncbi:MAG TPA: PP2C family protein-serine/threonine phosphatase [Bryobacteraceae bacterium]|nr:PP2C family protein-serine/threonine phosphatase [Bryobacteraceae bacterium]
MDANEVGANQIARRLGKSGVAFLIALLLFLSFYLLGKAVLAAITMVALVPLGAIVIFRVLSYIQRHSLWSVRNRLLFVYGLMGVLPIMLLFILAGLSVWGLTNDLAIYLATSALDRRLESIGGAVNGLAAMSPEQRLAVAPEIEKGFNQSFPGIRIYVTDENGDHKYPTGSPALNLATGWKDAHGLLVWQEHFYGWSHRKSPQVEVTALAPLTDKFIDELVPNLGTITLLAEGREKAQAGSLTIHLPPAVSTFDIQLVLPSTVPHYHLDVPNKTFDGFLWVHSRPSAVLTSFFSKSEFISGTLYILLATVAILFLLVELVAVIIGVRLSRRLTGAVNQLYEGTRRVLLGDFGHRIPVRTQDQIGELSESFNQMTVNLERLFVVEKEKERLQTELEIAREVQGQLYPKRAPPMRGLQLTVRCDPARMVSGDYYDYQEIAQHKLAFAIGDVAGKGISAALLMATLQAALRAQMAQYLPTHGNECSQLPDIDAAQVVSKLNKQIYAHTSPEKYATFFFAMFDEPTHTLTYTNAGHLSPLLLRNGDVIPLDSNGTVVGAFPFSKYDESCIILEPGDLLICYTDGITEPENAYGEEFGDARMVDLVKKNAHQDDQEIIRLVLDAVREWNGSPELHDDMTLLLARQVQRA